VSWRAPGARSVPGPCRAGHPERSAPHLDARCTARPSPGTSRVAAAHEQRPAVARTGSAAARRAAGRRRAAARSRPAARRPTTRTPPRPRRAAWRPRRALRSASGSPRGTRRASRCGPLGPQLRQGCVPRRGALQARRPPQVASLCAGLRQAGAGCEPLCCAPASTARWSVCWQVESRQRRRGKQRLCTARAAQSYAYAVWLGQSLAACTYRPPLWRQEQSATAEAVRTSVCGGARPQI